jgi:hypothetical protein
MTAAEPPLAPKETPLTVLPVVAVVVTMVVAMVEVIVVATVPITPPLKEAAALFDVVWTGWQPTPNAGRNV